jgi:hypothetical protein
MSNGSDKIPPVTDEGNVSYIHFPRRISNDNRPKPEQPSGDHYVSEDNERTLVNFDVRRRRRNRTLAPDDTGVPSNNRWEESPPGTPQAPDFKKLLHLHKLVADGYPNDLYTAGLSAALALYEAFETDTIRLLSSPHCYLNYYTELELSNAASVHNWENNLPPTPEDAASMEKPEFRKPVCERLWNLTCAIQLPQADLADNYVDIMVLASLLLDSVHTEDITADTIRSARIIFDAARKFLSDSTDDKAREEVTEVISRIRYNYEAAVTPNHNARSDFSRCEQTRIGGPLGVKAPTTAPRSTLGQLIPFKPLH